MANPNRPIFILGVHRSGTTLLRYMLSSHPRIYIPPESDFIPRFFQRHPHRSLSREEAIRILEIIFKEYRFVKEWPSPRPSAADLLTDLADLSPTSLLERLYTRYAACYRAERWGDKTPIYTSHIPLIHALFPQAQFIHLLRDGRDVALSMLEKWSKNEYHVDLYFAAQSWKNRIRLARQAAGVLPQERYLEIRYEALVSRPEVIIKEICDFIGETYDPAMARPHLLGQARIPAGDFHDPVRHPPGTQRIARWRNEMSASDIRRFQAIAGDLLQELQYPLLEDHDLELSDRWYLTRAGIKYHTLQFGRAVLQATGFFHPN